MKKKILSLALAIMLLAMLCACGGATEEAMKSTTAVSPMAPSAAPEKAPAMPEADFDYMADSGIASGSGSSAPAQNSTITADKIIYSAEAAIETKEYDKTIEAIGAMVNNYGGFMESSSIGGTGYGYNRGRTAYFTIRIPSDKFSALTGSLSQLGNVSYCNTYTENVTTQYIDVESRLESYRIQEERLLAMLEKAELLEDMLTIEDHLANVRYNIESYTTQLNYLDRQVSYSTVNLNVEEVVDYTPDQSVTRTFGDRMQGAFSDSLDSIVELFQGLILFLLRAWYLIIAIILIVVFLTRRARRELQKRRENQ